MLCAAFQDATAASSGGDTAGILTLPYNSDPAAEMLSGLFLWTLQGQKDYMGLAIKNDNLVYVYNLGGEDVEIPLTSKPVSQWPAVFNYIKVER